jgi:hypothetical protein
MVLVAPSPAALVADYQFNNNLQSSVGSPPDLQNIGGGNSFVTDTVNGQSRPVLQFPMGGGVLLTPTSGVIANGIYTIVVLFRFDEVGFGYKRIVSFKSPIEDTGLYSNNFTSFTTAELTFHDSSATDHFGTSPVIRAATYVQVVLTRDGSGTMVGYADGAQQFTFVDTSNDGVIVGDTLRFFKDDIDEESAGAVARIALFDTALTAAEVAALNPKGVGGMYGSTNNQIAGAVGAVGIVDQTNAAFSIIGDPTPGNEALTGIDFNSIGQLFGVANASRSRNPSVLIRIDPSIGALDATIGTVTDSVSMAGLRIVDLAFQPGSDVLFGIEQAGLLYRINTTTAVAVLVGDTGLGGSLGLAFAPNGTLYATSDRTLAQLDPSTGLPVSQMNMTFGPVGNECVDGLAVRPSDGLLFGTACDSDASVYRIDPITGVATRIGPASIDDDPDTSDLAFFRPVPPVPAQGVPALSGRGVAGLIAVLLICGGLRLCPRTRAVSTPD